MLDPLSWRSIGWTLSGIEPTPTDCPAATFVSDGSAVYITLELSDTRHYAYSEQKSLRLVANMKITLALLRYGVTGALRYVSLLDYFFISGIIGNNEFKTNDL